MNPTPGELVHGMPEEMQTSKKKMKYTIPSSLLSVITKIRECWVMPDTTPS